MAETFSGYDARSEAELCEAEICNQPTVTCRVDFETHWKELTMWTATQLDIASDVSPDMKDDCCRLILMLSTVEEVATGSDLRHFSVVV